MIRIVALAGLVLTLATPVAAADDWTPVAPGVEYQEFTGDHIHVHVARIDLTNDAIEVVATPELYRGTTVRDFASKTKALVAINADYFDSKLNPIGLAIGPCGQWAGSRDTSREGVVAVGRGRAFIQTQSEVYDPVEDWVTTAVSGWPMLVRDCALLSAKELPGSDAFTRAPHPRTAVGLSEDGLSLYFVVADGRRTGVPGLTLSRLAEFMADELSVCSAINLDGGGSTTMWVGDRVVNRPSDGAERRVADHLAVVLRSDAVCPPPTLLTEMEQRLEPVPPAQAGAPLPTTVRPAKSVPPPR